MGRGWYGLNPRVLQIPSCLLCCNYWSAKSRYAVIVIGTRQLGSIYEIRALGAIDLPKAIEWYIQSAQGG